jgi:hypothetical protein
MFFTLQFFIKFDYLVSQKNALMCGRVQHLLFHFEEFCISAGFALEHHELALGEKLVRDKRISTSRAVPAHAHAILCQNLKSSRGV